MSEMSEDQRRSNCGPGGSKAQIRDDLKKKSVEQLTDELAALMIAAADGNCDQDAIDAYAEVLNEKNPPPFDDEDIDAKYEAFMQKHAVLIAEIDAAAQRAAAHTSDRDTPIPSKKHPHILRRAASFAAVIAVFMGTMVSAQAFGFDVFGAIARWTAETFSFQSQDVPYAKIRTNPLAEGEEATYASLQDAVDAFDIQEAIAPTWLPERFTFSNATAVHQSAGISIITDYVSDDGYFQIRYNQVSQSSYLQAEIAGKEDVRVYDQNGISFFLTSDTGDEQVYWQNGELECYMGGSVSEGEMVDIIKSIYEERK